MAQASTLRSWREASGADLPLAVSLSPNPSCAPDLVDTVLGVLDDTALPADRLHLALSANEVSNGREQAVENLTLLAAAGVRTAVHDFGGVTGDLTRLADLPLRAVWLSPHLVARARAAARTSLVAKALAGVVTLVHLAGMTVSVDDVRSEQEADWWRSVEADTATGPWYSPRDEPTELAALFAGE